MPVVNHLYKKSSFAAAILLAALLAACTSAPVPLPTPTQTQAVETASPVPVEVFPQDVYILPNSLAWSPDDSVLAFTAGNGTAWIKKPGEPARVIEGIKTEDYANLFVSWSPIGSSLLVYGTWGSGYPYWTGLWKVDLEAGEVEQVQALVEPVLPDLVVHQNDSSISSVSWAADGRSFAYTFQADAWLYELESGTTRQLSRVPENPLEAEDMSEPFDGVRRLALSPAGRWLAVELSCNCPSPFSGVGVVHLDSGEARLLQKGAHLLDWSPDGQWVTLRNTTGDFSWDYTYDVYGANPLTGQLTNLTRSNPKFDPLMQGWDAYAPAEYQVVRLLWGPQGAYLYTLQDFAVEGSSAPEIPGEGFIAQRSLHALLAKYMPAARASYLYPHWLPDSRIAYIQVAPGEEAMFGRYPDWQPYILDQPLDKGGVLGMLAGAAWSPGGTYLAVLLVDEMGAPANRIELIPTSSGRVIQAPALQSTPTPPAPEETTAPTQTAVLTRLIQRTARTPADLYKPAVEIIPENGEKHEGHAVVLRIQNQDKLTGKLGYPSRWMGWGAASFAPDPEDGFWLVDVNNNQPRLIHISSQGELLQSLPLSTNGPTSLVCAEDALWLIDDHYNLQQYLVRIDRQSGEETVYELPQKIKDGLSDLDLSEAGEVILQRFGGFSYYRLEAGAERPAFVALPAYERSASVYQMSGSEKCQACWQKGYPYSDACADCIVRGPLLVDGKPVALDNVEHIWQAHFLGAAADGSFYATGRYPDNLVQKFSPSGERIGLARIPPSYIYYEASNNIRLGPDGEVYAMLGLEDQDQIILRLTFTPALASLVLPTPYPDDWFPPEIPPLRPTWDTPPLGASAEEIARQTLITYFSRIAEGRYEETAQLYGGGEEGFRGVCEGKEGFCEQHLAELTSEPEAFWQKACAELVWCMLYIGEIVEVEQISGGEFLFWAMHVVGDFGERYTARGCCTTNDAAIYRPVWLYPYIVKRIDGHYKVMQPPPAFD